MIDAHAGKSNYEFGLLQTQSSSFALSFASRDRVVYVFAKIGFLGMKPVFYFDLKDFFVLNRNDRPKTEIDEVALKSAVIRKASEHFETFYLRTDDKEDFLVTYPLETRGVKEEHHLVCLPLTDRIVPFEDYFESGNI